jgi:regulatory protein
MGTTPTVNEIKRSNPKLITLSGQGAICMQITSVEKNKNNDDVMMVYVDGEYSFSITEEEYFKRNFYEKREITQAEIEEIKHVHSYKTAKSAALKYLTLKLRSADELRQKLESLGYDSETTEKAVSELASLGYINDTIYVQKYLYDRSKLKPKPKRMLKLELLKKGIKESIIDEILSEWQIDEPSLARRLVKKKYGKYDLRDEKIIRRVYNFLMHRGFSLEIINSVVRNIEE